MDTELGWRVDGVVGVLSRVLHGVRGAELDTSRDLGPYLDLPTREMFPAPRSVPDVADRRSLSLVPGHVAHALSWRSDHVPICPYYRHRHQGAYAVNLTARARWLHRPTGPRRRVVVYVHGWLEPGPAVAEATLLRALSHRLDVDVVHAQLPFHGARNPRSALFHGELFWSADLVRSVEAVRQSIGDVRALIAWLRARGYDEVGVVGMSLGGALTMILACVESPPDWVCPIVAHVDLAHAVEHAPILWRMRADLERFGVDRARRAEIFDRLGFARARPIVPPERQLWVAATGDMYLQADVVEAQWRAWGRPPILWVPTGHMTFPLSIEAILARLSEFAAPPAARRAS